MNATEIARSIGRKAVFACNAVYFHTASLRIGLAAGSLALTYPQLSNAAGSDSGSGARMGLGRTIEGMSRELGTGFTQAVKVGAAVIGIGMVAYSIYGVTLGRKKDEREYPLGSTMAIGIGGAVLLGLTAFAGILSSSFFGSEGVDVGESFNLDEVDSGADRGANDTGQ